MNARLPVIRTTEFNYAVLAVGERFMDELVAKARLVSATLRKAGIRHAVIGGLAVRAHLADVDGSASMTTRDMDLLMRKEDLDRAIPLMQELKFRVVLGTPAFIPEGKTLRDGIHVLLAGEKPRLDSLYAAPLLDENSLLVSNDGFPVIDLAGLVLMKLNSLTPKDVAHLEDFLELGMISPEIQNGLPPELRERLEKVRKDWEPRRQGF